MLLLSSALCLVFLQISSVNSANTKHRYSGSPGAADNDLHPIFQGLAPEDPLARFQPNIYQEGDSCAPHVYVDAAGVVASGLFAHQTCTDPFFGGQLIGRKRQYEDKYALLYTAFYPYGYKVLKNTGKLDWGTMLLAYQRADFLAIGFNWATLVIWTDGPDALEYEFLKGVQPLNPFALKRERFYKSDNGFVAARSPVGYYWLEGVGGRLTENELINYDNLGLSIKILLASRRVIDDDPGQASTTNHCPFVPFFTATLPTDPTESFMNCDEDTILRNQYELFYGSGRAARYCI